MNNIDNLALFEFNEHEQTTNFETMHVKRINYQTAKTVIEPNHYLGKLGSTAMAFGAYIDNEIAGAMTFGTIPSPNASGICGPYHKHKVYELTRLYMYDWAGKNAESKFIGTVFKQLKPYAMHNGGLIIISYADTEAGHVGQIYQATNFIYTGESVAQKVVTETGEILHSRVASDSRRGMSSAGMQRISTPPKHRYIKFIGDKTQIKTFNNDLRWQRLPYPKPETNHDN